MVSIEIKSFPMPPSANALYADKPGGGRIKSSKYKAYEDQVRIWTYKYGYMLQNARIIMQNREHDELFYVERIFYFRKDKILTSKNKPFKNDTTNRIKALDDVLGQLLGIDDSYFWDGEYKKRPSAHVALGEYVDIRITTMKLEIPLTDQDA